MSGPTILVANRGEIAVRIMRTARRLGCRTAAVFSDADADAEHVRKADLACRIGPPAPAESYLRIDAIIAAARRTGATAVHPGYGFLSERAEFAEACRDAGLLFIGPSPEAMRALGNKAAAKTLAAASQIPVVPGYAGENTTDDAYLAAAAGIGFPVMIKAAAGGGGRGMRLVTSAEQLPDALRSARAEAQAAFGDGSLLLECAISNPRHVEVQVFGDTRGNFVHLGERDCSVQRRHQKVIEEAPSPAVTPVLRERLGSAAIAIARAAQYTGAGTVEFLLDEEGAFYFIEANTRLQVEHPVTEAITGLDLVEWQIRIALGEPLPCRQEDITLRGHAIEARLCAEDPARGFVPQVGEVRLWQPPAGVRTDHALRSGSVVSPHYDSLIAKLIAHGPTREVACSQLAQALDDCVLLGIRSNREFLGRCLKDEAFRAGAATTDFVASRSTVLLPPQPVLVSADRAMGVALLYLCYVLRLRLGAWAGWSNTGVRVTPLTVRFRGEATAVDCLVSHESPVRFRVRVGADELTLTVDSGPASDSGKARLELDGVLRSVAYVFDDGVLEWQAGAVVHQLIDATQALRTSTRDALLDGCLRAPMHGRVIAVPAAADERADAGKPLVVLEAMKMEHTLVLPVAARVTAVGVAVGDQVAAGSVLLRYEPVEGAAP